MGYLRQAVGWISGSGDLLKTLLIKFSGDLFLFERSAYVCCMKKRTFSKRKCECCEKVFPSRYRASRTKYCSASCRASAWRERLKNGIKPVPKRSDGGGVKMDECLGCVVIMRALLTHEFSSIEVYAEDDGGYSMTCGQCDSRYVIPPELVNKVPAMSLD